MQTMKQIRKARPKPFGKNERIGLTETIKGIGLKILITITSEIDSI